MLRSLCTSRRGRLGIPAAMLLAASLSVAVSMPSAARGADLPPAFALAWGGAGVKAGNMMAPRAVAVDKDDNIYVPDKSGRLQKFGPNGKQLQEWGGSGDFERMFQEPAAVAIDATGMPLVADAAVTRKYDASGESTERWIAAQAQGIAATTHGAFYVTEAKHNCVLLFDGPGKPKQMFGKPGTGPGEFAGPAGIAIDGKGDVYIADAGNNRVQKFKADGTFVLQWGGPGTGPSQFDTPQGVAVDKAGNVYVVDQKNARVQKFKADGTFVLQWGAAGEANGQFNAPTGIAVDKRGNVYVADTGNNRIQKFIAK